MSLKLSCSTAVFLLLAVGPGLPQSSPGAPQSTSVQTTLTIPEGHKIILRLETAIHTNSTRKGDRVEFQTAADVVVNDRLVIPDGSWVRATVSKSKRAGRIAGRAEVQLHFDEVRLNDGKVLPLKATIVRVGFDPVQASKQGDPGIKGESGSGGSVGAVLKGGGQGALIGVLTAGGKGAMYGGAIGAGVTLAGMVLRRGPDVDLPRDTMFEARFDAPLSVPVSATQRAEAVNPWKIYQPERTEGATDATPSVPRPILRRRERAEQPPPPIPPDTPVPGPTIPAPPEPAPSDAPPAQPSSAPAETLPVDTGGFKLSVDVKMVVVDAVIRDRAGRMIENLTQKDFRILEDGVEQPIATFSRDELPLAVALVVDRSGSVAPYIDELRRVAERALDRLKPEDQVALFSFAGSVERVVDLTRDRREISRGLSRIRAGGGTDIIDALFDATVYLAKVAPDHRRAVILVSDNQATVNPQESEGSTIRMAMESETVVYSLKTSGEAPPLSLRLPNLMGGAGSVKKVVQETGGEIFDVSKVGMVDTALSTVLMRLRMRYSLGYYPPSAGQGGAYHSIDVVLSDRLGQPGKDYFVIARRGYYTLGDRTAARTQPKP